MITSLLILFVAGYLLITLEHAIKINKTATSLITGIVCWAVYALSGADPEAVSHQLGEHLTGVAEILFFLLGAMTVVELIDAHDGFTLITDRISSRNTRVLLWVICLLTFFLSALLDNLTTAIVMVSVARKLVKNTEQRRVIAGMIIVSANAGGAWSPIGDVTTTMLWIGGQVTTINIIRELILPSLVALLVPLVILTMRYKADTQVATSSARQGISRPYVTPAARRERRIMLAIGLGGMVFVPIFKTFTHLPPYMGMMLVLGCIWVASEVLHSDKDEAERQKYTAAYALSRIDAPSILFFLGILLAVGALESTGILRALAESLSRSVGNLDLIILLIGAVSAVVDNVPIVAATMGMYDLQTYPADAKLWEFLAYCAGTGGSMLLIGSAAGVAVMGMERLAFGWYLRNISWLALIGYVAGALVYLAEFALSGH
ncbi:sodium:proton antiporter NhaD [Spirosoma utsteinense]|uniref:Na+/H+ antiporter NhaD/arsenite permease-like protein n=1 Tax=Spirosoma utsteinense TaxID=2585773 RepID=A0ABR6W062_9BACT|nr:sodium:proton antiporter NhaD [Spirosoma utsteinense]MBC3788142.1 Na+/H+ antiporter NhaD/arsenite permease-like protein [Spirosoma utsteinense]MBC3789996.1 Na+/H+ antiporter NhaD/arsenite permease-like protein [Spirosoma utsteinense]